MILTTIAALLLGSFWVSVVALGGVVVWRGLCGRLVDRLPRCRRCGYLLIGFAVRPSTCAECGAGLLGSRKVRVGRRARRRWLVVGGMAILLAAIGPIVLGLLPSSATVAKPAPVGAAAARRTITLVAPPKPVMSHSGWWKEQDLERPIPKRERPARGSRRLESFAPVKAFGVGRLVRPEIEPLVPERVRGRAALPRLLTPPLGSLIPARASAGWSATPAPQRPGTFGSRLPLQPIFNPAGGPLKLSLRKPSLGAISTPPLTWRSSRSRRGG